MKNNVEIEVKVLEINTKELEKKLVAVGAKKIFSNNKIVQESYKNKELQKKRASIRVRQIGKELYITFKEFKEIKQNVKNCKEIEFQVSSDFKTIQEVFLALGLKKHRRIEKIRNSYKLKDITFDIDEVIKPFKIPCYFEIEAKSYKEIEKTLLLLDIPKSKVKPWGTGKLLKHYEKMKK